MWCCQIVRTRTLFVNWLSSTGIVMLVERRSIIDEVIMLSDGRRSTGSFWHHIKIDNFNSKPTKVGYIFEDKEVKSIISVLFILLLSLYSGKVRSSFWHLQQWLQFYLCGRESLGFWCQTGRGLDLLPLTWCTSYLVVSCRVYLRLIWAWHRCSCS